MIYAFQTYPNVLELYLYRCFEKDRYKYNKLSDINSQLKEKHRASKKLVGFFEKIHLCICDS